jgi:hypothetical protein
MKASELRIGNLVEDENGYYQIEAEHLDDDVFPILQTWGIPLTEEWLLKFGFELDIEDDGYQKGKYKVSVSDEGCLFFINIGYYPEEIAEFKYVHQLQNLYFALAGEEIVVKE